MHIGVDFDNTIICYDNVFHKIAQKTGLIPSDFSIEKNAIRDFLRRVGKEEKWTLLQGEVYGKMMYEAKIFEGVKDFFRWCHTEGVTTSIISHKTKYPYAGTRYDLHRAAWQWLETQEFFSDYSLGLDRSRVFFELTKEKKINRILDEKCTHFIDDLPELLLAHSFPQVVIPVLFDHGNYLREMEARILRFCTWGVMTDWFKSVEHDVK